MGHMIPQTIPNPSREPVTDGMVCHIADKWGVAPVLVDRLVSSQAELPFDIWIFSGSRSRSHQASVSRTPFEDTTHADTNLDGCPRDASGADVQPVSPGVRLDPASVALMGSAFVRHGLRWGGGASVEPSGIPVGVERWHVDLGPRIA